MKSFKLSIIIVVALCLFCTSCIQSEALNSEADIEECIVSGNILITTPNIENNRITLRIKPAVDPAVLSKLAVEFVLTPGATIDPPSGTVRDFTQSQTYKVTSEDGDWTKEYTINCIVGGIRTLYNFENYRLITGGLYKYYEFYELNEEGKDQIIWGSGNLGFNSIPMKKEPEDFPTVAVKDGLNGACVKMETRDTGPFGKLMKMPLAAGNLFMGRYAGGLDALKATEFGEPVDFIPTGITGYYKYKAGEEYKDKAGNVVAGKKDNFDIYGILYETDDEVKSLDGTNCLTSPNLVSIARITEEEKKETEEWTHFYIPFNVLPGKEISTEKLIGNKYKISVVFSSSIDGATFSGAVGSTLYIDEVELIHLEK